MRELEFLPDWYPKVRQRKRMVALQAWITLILVCGLGLWMLLVQRNVHAREIELSSLRTDVSQSETEVHRLEELLTVDKELTKQDEIFLRIGRPVESTRLLTTLEEIMPRDMALLDLQMDTEEAPKAQPNAAHPQVDMRPAETKLHFRLHGVAPTDVDLAEFIAKLTGKPFFRQVELMYSHERVDNGHVMREFEVSFDMELGGLSVSGGAFAMAGGH